MKVAELNVAALLLLAHLQYSPAKQVRIVSRVKIVVAKRGVEQNAVFSPHVIGVVEHAWGAMTEGHCARWATQACKPPSHHRPGFDFLPLTDPPKIKCVGGVSGKGV